MYVIILYSQYSTNRYESIYMNFFDLLKIVFCSTRNYFFFCSGRRRKRKKPPPWRLLLEVRGSLVRPIWKASTIVPPPKLQPNYFGKIWSAQWSCPIRNLWLQMNIGLLSTNGNKNGKGGCRYRSIRIPYRNHWWRWGDAAEVAVTPGCWTNLNCKYNDT